MANWSRAAKLHYREVMKLKRKKKAAVVREQTGGLPPTEIYHRENKSEQPMQASALPSTGPSVADLFKSLSTEKQLEALAYIWPSRNDYLTIESHHRLG